MLATALFLLVYFLPAIVGFYRKHHRAWAIFALNLFLGWTVVGWIVALVWATTAVQQRPMPKERDRIHRQEMLGLRAMTMDLQKILFPENPTTGALVRVKTGLHLEQQLETRFGIMGPDFLTSVASDHELEREGKLLDKLPPEQLAQIATELDRLAKRVCLERGDPEEWEGGAETANAANIIALRLLQGWLVSKCIVHTSMNREVVKEAQENEDLYYTHIKWMLRLFRGEEAIKEGEEFYKKEATRPGDNNTVLDVLNTIRALQEKGASEEEWEFVLTKQQAKLRAAIKARTHPQHGIDEKDRKFVVLEEAISAALKEGKRPEL